ncbi:MAG: fused response regulator/phosphatase [Burkholderiaceae bacterium]
MPTPAPPVATLLIVDDKPENLNFFRNALEQDYTILTALSGELALRLAAEHQPDLILLDVMMPVMGGFEVARALSRDPRLSRIPLVFLTANTDTTSQLQGLELGAKDFIIKPTSLGILRKRVANVITQIQLDSQTERHRSELEQVNQQLQQTLSELETQKQALARIRQQEIEIGAAIQKNVLFGNFPRNLEGLRLASFSEPSQGVDGDFQVFTQLSPHSFEVLVGDVMGKGVAAALFAASVICSYRTTFMDLMSNTDGEVMPSVQDIVNAMHQSLTPNLIEIGSFVTLALLRIDRLAQTVTWCSAGHPPCLLTSSRYPTVIELGSENLPIGVLESECYQEHTRPVAVGDNLLLYSDGISEAISSNNTLYGNQRIAAILHQGQQIQACATTILNSLRSDLKTFSPNSAAPDDRTAVLIQVVLNRNKTRIAGSIADRRAPNYRDVEPELHKLEPLRKKIAAFTLDQPEEFTQSLVLAAFEVATNVIRHGDLTIKDAPIVAVLQRSEEAISIELQYAGKPFVPEHASEPDFSGNQDHGFGLFIVENSVDQVLYGTPMPGISSIRLVKQLEQQPPKST